MEVDTSGRMVLPGAVVPRGGRLGVALLAGALWVAAVVMLLPLPGELRAGVLYRQATDEGLGLMLPFARLVAATLALLLAHALSRRAHGRARPRLRPAALFLDEPKPWVRAPRIVVGARVATWVVFVLVVAVADQVAAIHLGPGECFRTCAPYPR